MNSSHGRLGRSLSVAFSYQLIHDSENVEKDRRDEKQPLPSTLKERAAEGGSQKGYGPLFIYNKRVQRTNMLREWPSPMTEKLQITQYCVISKHTSFKRGLVGGLNWV